MLPLSHHRQGERVGRVSFTASGRAFFCVDPGSVPLLSPHLLGTVLLAFALADLRRPLHSFQFNRKTFPNLVEAVDYCLCCLYSLNGECGLAVVPQLTYLPVVFETFPSLTF